MAAPSKKNGGRRRRQPSWPRHWYNFPIILCGIAMQYIWAIAIAASPGVMNTTIIHSLLLYMPDPASGLVRWLLVLVLCTTATLAIAGFQFKRNINTVIAFLPQQFIMFLSAGGSIHAMATGTFADGTVRDHWFLIADQSAPLVITIFHTWAVILLTKHGADELELD